MRGDGLADRVEERALLALARALGGSLSEGADVKVDGGAARLGAVRGALERDRMTQALVGTTALFRDRDLFIHDGSKLRRFRVSAPVQAVFFLVFLGLVVVTRGRRPAVGPQRTPRSTSAVMTAVIAQPCNRSTGPKSATGTRGAGLMTGTARHLATSSSAGAVTTTIVGCPA